MDISNIPTTAARSVQHGRQSRTPGPYLRSNSAMRFHSGRRSPKSMGLLNLDAGVMMGQGILKMNHHKDSIRHEQTSDQSMRSKKKKKHKKKQAGGNSISEKDVTQHRIRPSTSAVTLRNGNSDLIAASSLWVPNNRTTDRTLKTRSDVAEGRYKSENASSDGETVGNTSSDRGEVVLHDALPADSVAPLLLVDTNCPFRASTARQFETELTTSFPLPLSQYPRSAVVYSRKDVSPNQLIVQLRYLASVPGPHFGGSEEPAAFCELLMSAKQMKALTYSMRLQLQIYISSALDRYFGVRPDRYYLRFMDRDAATNTLPNTLSARVASISGAELMSQTSMDLLQNNQQSVMQLRKDNPLSGDTDVESFSSGW